MNRTRKSSAYSIAMHEKSIRTERKENFKLQSAWVKGQEEIKSVRTFLRLARSDLDAEKQKLDQREQETFSAQYKLIGTQEALTTTQERLKVLEAERDALKTSLKEEEVARIAAEGRIALPVPKRIRGGANVRNGAEEEDEDEGDEDDIDFFSDGYNLTHGISPLKSPNKRTREPTAMLETVDADDAGSDKENASAPLRNNFHTKSTSHPNLRLYQDQHYRQQKESRHLQQQSLGQQQQISYSRLESEIANERARREQAEETVEFLKMECQFRCCSCRVAEEKEAKYVYDESMVEGMEVVRKEAREAMHLDIHNNLDTDMDEGEGIDAAPEVGNDVIAGGKIPFELSAVTSANDSEKDYFSLVPAGEDSRMLDKSGITPDDEIDTKQNNANAGPAESAETRVASLCFSPTSGTFRSASAASASSSAGAGSAPTTAAPTADTSFDSDQSNYATPPINMDRPSNHGRVLPFKPLLDTIPSHPASPYQDGLAVGQGDEQDEQFAECNETGSIEKERDWQRREPTGDIFLNNKRNNGADIDEIGHTYKGTERYYTPAEELDIRTVEDKFGVNVRGNVNSKDSNILATQAYEHEQEQEQEQELEQDEEQEEDNLTNSNTTTTTDPQTPVQASSSRGRFMLRTVTTTTQVPLQSTPVVKNTNDSSSSGKVMTTPHQHFNHDYNHNYNHSHPSTTGPRPQHDRRYHHHHHHHHQPPTPMTAPLPSSSSSSSITTAGNVANKTSSSSLTEREREREHDHPFLPTSGSSSSGSSSISDNKSHHNHHHHHHHTPIDRATALAQIQARRGRARSLAEGLQQQQQQQHGMTPRSGPINGQTTTTTTMPAGAATTSITGNGNRIMKRDTRDVSAPALKGRAGGG